MRSDWERLDELQSLLLASFTISLPATQLWGSRNCLEFFFAKAGVSWVLITYLSCNSESQITTGLTNSISSKMKLKLEEIE